MSTVARMRGGLSSLRPVDLEDVYVAGDLQERAVRNLERLETRRYQVPELFQAEDFPWPADMEGRTLLALVRLARATHRTPRHLEAIVEELPKRLNARGYLGRVLPKGTLDEQQLSGHAWLLRGLCELHEWRGDATSRELAERLVENLLLPARGYYARYPSRPEDRDFDGEAVGTLSRKANEHWYSSTDIGCAFIMLDGASHAHALFPDAALGDLIQEMTDAFLSLDFRGISCQTHATLSGLRGLLRYAEQAGRDDLIAEALRVWSLYTTEGATANYANCNWFGRPQWTEPCAMVDAFMAGVQLWRLTGDAEHLEFAHGTYFNGLGHGQRSNGGFGCDACAGPGGAFLAVHPKHYEAWWCCTMRGGEGLSRAVEYGWFAEGDTLTLPFYWDGTVRATFADGAMTIVERTRYPYAGEVVLDVAASTVQRPKRLRLFVPSFSRDGAVRVTVDGRREPARVDAGFATVTLPPRAGTRVELAFPTAWRAEAPLNVHSTPGHHVFRHGPLVLGCRDADAPARIPRDVEAEALGNGHYRAAGSDTILAPVNDTLHRTEREALAGRRRLLFGD